jgi:LmbE family N-acetylglucosaminyl deacetylase
VLPTGGTFARYAEEGVRTVLVTCTNGEQGDGPGGVKPGEEGHDEAAVRERRLVELRESAAHLGIEHVELLGYADSGMAGWEANSRPDAFANVPLQRSAARLTALMDKYRPQVVVTYDEDGGYGHPDHIQAHRIAVVAADALRERRGIPHKLYYTAVPRSWFREIGRLLRAAGLVGDDETPPADFGVPDEKVTTYVDVLPYVERKRKALESHASQADNIVFLRMPEEAQRRVLGTETFVRVRSDVAVPKREDDLFAGLR